MVLHRMSDQLSFTEMLDFAFERTSRNGVVLASQIYQETETVNELCGSEVASRKRLSSKQLAPCERMSHWWKRPKVDWKCDTTHRNTENNSLSISIMEQQLSTVFSVQKDLQKVKELKIIFTWICVQVSALCRQKNHKYICHCWS